jgi:hypothetical protein
VEQKGEDRRQQPRFPCNGNAEIRSLESGLCATGKIENLSLCGCRLLVEDCHKFRAGETVEMSFIVRQLPLRVQASVRQLHSGKAVGVVFTLLSERGKRQLCDLIDELAELLRDQVDGLIQYQSSLAAAPSECRKAPGAAEPGEKDARRVPGKPVPIDRGAR